MSLPCPHPALTQAAQIATAIHQLRDHTAVLFAAESTTAWSPEAQVAGLIQLTEETLRVLAAYAVWLDTYHP
jgi:hypothetical protein